MVTKTKNSAGFVHVILISVAALLAVTVIGYLVYHQVQVNKERQLYAQADKEAQAYINAIAEKYPGEMKHYTYCDYSSAKLGKGSLGCIVESEVTIKADKQTQNEVLKIADEEQKKVNWAFAYNNTENNLQTGYKNLIKLVVYNKQPITCSIKYEYPKSANGIDEPKVRIATSCGGNAMAEYYKVIEH